MHLSPPFLANDWLSQQHFVYLYCLLSAAFCLACLRLGLRRMREGHVLVSLGAEPHKYPGYVTVSTMYNPVSKFNAQPRHESTHNPGLGSPLITSWLFRGPSASMRHWNGRHLGLTPWHASKQCPVVRHPLSQAFNSCPPSLLYYSSNVQGYTHLPAHAHALLSSLQQQYACTLLHRNRNLASR